MTFEMACKHTNNEDALTFLGLKGYGLMRSIATHFHITYKNQNPTRNIYY